MKAVIILLGTVLPQVIVGSIFRQESDSRRDNLIVNPLQHIDQYRFKPEQSVQFSSEETNNDYAKYIRQYAETFDAQNEANKQRLEREKTRRIQELRENSEERQVKNKKNRRHHSSSEESRETQFNQLTKDRKHRASSEESRENKYYLHGKNKRSSSEESREQVKIIPRYRTIRQRNEELFREEHETPKRYMDEDWSDERTMHSFKNKEQSDERDSKERDTKEMTHKRPWLNSAKRNKYNKYTDEKSNESSEHHRSQELYLDSAEKDKIPTFADAITWRGLSFVLAPRGIKNQKDIKNIFGDAYDTMKPISEKDRQRIEQASATETEDDHLNATELLRKNQYDVEEHIVKTDDGYILTLFRIPAKQMTRNVQKAPVVFLMHGLLGSADDWLLMGPGKSLAYLLSDAGYDVWLGNARGNKYSRQHVAKHPAQPEFWEFSNDDIARHDLPTMIDYVLHTSQQEKLTYVGHSLGTTAFFALVASRPEYNSKISKMFALSPMVYMSHVRSPLIKMVAPNNMFYETLQQLLGNGKFIPNKELLSTVGGSMLQKKIGVNKVSSNVNFVMSGMNVDQMETEQIEAAIRHLPAGGSTRQVKQYGQAVASMDFRMYDFGPEMNKMVYGSRQPPKYDLKAVETPVALFYSEMDWLAHPKDVERLKNALPNVTDFYKVPEMNFGSLEFQLGKSAPEVVNKRIIKSLAMETTN